MGEVSEFERKKLYLNQYQEAQRKIAGLTAEMEKWGCLATKVNQAYNLGGSGGGNGSSKAETGAVNITALLAQIQAEIITAENVRGMVVKACEKATKRRYKALLQMRFVNGLSPAKIAEACDKDERSIRRSINHAIDELDI